MREYGSVSIRQEAFIAALRMREEQAEERVFKTATFGYDVAMNEESAIHPDFAAPEEAAAYDTWLREKVARSLADPRPPVPHEEAMARIQSIIDEATARKC
jgi:hypothetical protein